MVRWHRNFSSSITARNWRSMVMDEFNTLSLNDRVYILMEKGNFLESFAYHNYYILLYSLGTHFIELFYDKSTSQIVWILEANENDLNKYLNQIELKL